MNTKTVRPGDDPPFYRYALIGNLAIEAPANDLRTVVTHYLAQHKGTCLDVTGQGCRAVMINDFRPPDTAVFEETLNYEEIEIDF